MAKCRHPNRLILNLANAMRCCGCGRHLSLGPSNDDIPPEEILAAELGQNPDVWWRWQNCEPAIDDDLTRIGARGFLQLGAFAPDAAHAFLTPVPFQDDLDRRDYWAGWLARDIAAGVAFTRDESDAWWWDPSRPIAGQYEEHAAHQAAGDAQIEALIDEQTRHDVAASVVRHSELEPQLTRDEMSTVIAQSSNSFAPFDTASHEPWHIGSETQDSGVSIDETRPIGGVTSAEVVEVESLCAPIVAALADLSMTAEPPEGWKERTMAAIDDRFDPDGEL